MTNIAIYFFTRKTDPDIRVVTSLASEVLHETVADGDGPSAILDLAALTTSAVVEACLRQDVQMHAGYFTAMVDTTDEVDHCDIRAPHQAKTRSHHSQLYQALDAAHTIYSEINPAFYPVLATLGALMLGSTTLSRFRYKHPGIS
ncbi:hypothetical protein [Mycobacterium uberis]|uniref:hypothetical protein n=1 Tax=Mycobacterium uberis TaxID=2162698 RepID=UPI000E300942|nr:hypothetical protein [Mycobacterium uberis]